jgi:hypothetical protein
MSTGRFVLTSHNRKPTTREPPLLAGDLAHDNVLSHARTPGSPIGTIPPAADVFSTTLKRLRNPLLSRAAPAGGGAAELPARK